MRKVNSRIGKAILVATAATLSLTSRQAQAQNAAAPKTENAKVEQRAISGTLTETVDRWTQAADHAEWLAYSVPTASADRSVCCGNDWSHGSCGPCRLEGSEHGSNINLRGDKIQLEGPRRI